ncbi:hypothetical protein [Calidithermus chliarophilus]|uniref:hypothetical protein n=1 Tax=Calidithermus chliarophilus TaxID=52023 RepID=UPI000422C17A|nr:hypothetical protein [Calidithermus chliarophilus]
MSAALKIALGAAGVALLGVGAYALTRPLPAEQTVEGSSLVPKDTDPDGKATKLQLLAALEADLRRWQGAADAAAQRMRQIETASAPPCEAYAQSPVWKYNCNGFPVCSLNEWHSLEGSSRDRLAYSQCQNYVRGLGPLAQARTLESKSSHPTDRQKLQALREGVAQGYAQATDLREQYRQAQAEQQAAQAKAEEVKRKLADLNAQGVF